MHKYKDESLLVYHQFTNIETLTEFAEFLKITPRKLSFILYKLDGGVSEQYTDFTIPKKNGGPRSIKAPSKALKVLQSKLSKKLDLLYYKHKAVHGFLESKSIKTNAKQHNRKRFVLNFDLKDFFGSINFGRVRGLFLSPPFNLSPNIATIIAQIVTVDNSLPQGAPTSPVISNMISLSLDIELKKIGFQEKCTYTRYADDITFSTNLKRFPEAIYCGATKSLNSNLVQTIYDKHGFKINKKKTRISHKSVRQEVTGLVVNKKVNVKRSYRKEIRGMLNAWSKYGLEDAEKKFKAHYRPKCKASFHKVVSGKIEFLRSILSDEDGFPECYKKLRTKYHQNHIKSFGSHIILTEGKTDYIHIELALKYWKSKGKFQDLDLHFYKESDRFLQGSGNLSSFLYNPKHRIPKGFKLVGVFDRDEPKVIKNYEEGGIKEYASGIISVLLPAECCDKALFEIEDLYPESVYKASVRGLRLYRKDEFCKATKKHLEEEGLRLKSEDKSSSVIVLNSEGKNVSLSKSGFAKGIASGKIKLTEGAFQNFIPLLSLLESLTTESKVIN